MSSNVRTICALLSLCCLAGVMSCSPTQVDSPVLPQAAPRPAATTQPVPRLNAAKVARAVHDRINQERRRQGLPTYRWDAALGRIAGKHSRDMAKRNYFGHASPEGNGPAQRYLKGHYACGVTVNGVLRRGAEVLHRGQPVAAEGAAARGKAAAARFSDAVIGDWLGTEAERADLLSPHWQREGVGVFVLPDGTVFVTVNFC